MSLSIKTRFLIDGEGTHLLGEPPDFSDRRQGLSGPSLVVRFLGGVTRSSYVCFGGGKLPCFRAGAVKHVPPPLPCAGTRFVTCDRLSTPFGACAREGEGGGEACSLRKGGMPRRVSENHAQNNRSQTPLFLHRHHTFVRYYKNKAPNFRESRQT